LPNAACFDKIPGKPLILFNISAFSGMRSGLAGSPGISEVLEILEKFLLYLRSLLISAQSWFGKVSAAVKRCPFRSIVKRASW
jgi:hypothetical protein